MLSNRSSGDEEFPQRDPQAWKRAASIMANQEGPSMEANLHKYSQAFCHAAAEECTRASTAWLDGQTSDQELLDLTIRIARQIDGLREEEVEGYGAHSESRADAATRAYRTLLEAFRRATAARSAVVVLNTVNVGADDASSLRRATFRRIISQQGVLPWGSAPIPHP